MKRVFILKGLDCPNCSAKIEKEVGALPGVESSVVNLMQQTLTVQSEKSADATLAEQVETIVHSHFHERVGANEAVWHPACHRDG